MTRRDSLGQMSHSDLVELVLEQERIFEEAAQEWKAELALMDLAFDGLMRTADSLAGDVERLEAEQ